MAECYGPDRGLGTAMIGNTLLGSVWSFGLGPLFLGTMQIHAVHSDLEDGHPAGVTWSILW